MKKIKALTLLSSFALTMCLASCGGNTGNSAAGSQESTPAGSQTSTASSSQLEKIELTTEGSKTLHVGETLQINSSVEGVTYKSSNEKVATVDQTGKVTATGLGTASISAEKEGYRKGSMSVTVERHPASGKVEFEDADHVA
ncbi:MAG: Ig-like domain-containing protein, partial [Bacilli bacterium]|nr:Ig-like domain-containing protein [Bacilli bacterium]